MLAIIYSSFLFQLTYLKNSFYKIEKQKMASIFSVILFFSWLRKIFYNMIILEKLEKRKKYK